MCDSLNLNVLHATHLCADGSCALNTRLPIVPPLPIHLPPQMMPSTLPPPYPLTDRTQYAHTPQLTDRTQYAHTPQPTDRTQTATQPTELT